MGAVHSVLSSTCSSIFFSLSHHRLQPSISPPCHAHSLPLFLILTGPWKIGQPLCKEERRVGVGGCVPQKRGRNKASQRGRGWGTSGGSNEVGRRSSSRWKMPCVSMCSSLDNIANIVYILPSFIHFWLRKVWWFIVFLKSALVLKSKEQLHWATLLKVVSQPAGPVLESPRLHVSLRLLLTSSRSSDVRNTASVHAVLA